MSKDIKIGDPEALPYAVEFSNAFFNTLSLGLIASDPVLISLSLFHLSGACWNGAMYYFSLNIKS